MGESSSGRVKTRAATALSLKPRLPCCQLLQKLWACRREAVIEYERYFCPIKADTFFYKDGHDRTSLVVQWLELHIPSAGSSGSMPGQRTKTLQALWCGQKIEK